MNCNPSKIACTEGKYERNKEQLENCHLVEDKLEASITELGDEKLNPFFGDNFWITYRSDKEMIQVERIKNKFENCWSCVNLGERILNDYIETCTFRKEFTKEFFEGTNRQLR